jgi:small subunit ribosomal protein S6
MQTYDLMMLYKPLLMEDIKKKTISKIQKLVKDLGGDMTEVDNLGKRILAYPIKKFDEGHYVRYELSLDPSRIEEFKTDVNLLDDVLRFLVIKK